jgi:hypothetical protein
MQHEVTAETASAVSEKGWKETRFRKDEAFSESEKNVSCMSSASVFASFLSFDTYV